MKRYHLQAKYSNSFNFLTEMGILFTNVDTRTVEISQTLTREQKVSILKQCDAIKATMFAGKPQKNFGNAVLQIL